LLKEVNLHNLLHSPGKEHVLAEMLNGANLVENGPLLVRDEAGLAEVAVA
jgi:translation initiation factor 2 gamma subunit (eIF-2gamma)